MQYAPLLGLWALINIIMPKHVDHDNNNNNDDNDITTQNTECTMNTSVGAHRHNYMHKHLDYDSNNNDSNITTYGMRHD